MIKFLIDPFNLFWLLLAATLIFSFLKKERLCRWFAIVSIGWFLIISTPFIPSILLDSLENKYEPIYVNRLGDPLSEYHIIVLGGGHGVDKRLPQNSLLSLNALGRLNEGIRLHNQLPNSRLVLSGSAGRTAVSQAELLRQTALLIGVDETAMLIQPEPDNTYSEAEIYWERFSEKYPVILVTSASHMPRAVMLFERFGITVIPSPANYRLKGENRITFFGLPSLKNVEYMRNALYEYVAILRYSLL